MTQAILNPVKLKSLLPLLPAESKFARCLGEGKLCVVGNGELPHVPIIHGDSANPANVVRPEVIRFFVFGGSDDRLVRGARINLQGAMICGERPLDLTHASIPYALGFFACHFAVAVEMGFAECEALYLNGSHMAHGLSAHGLKTKGAVLLRDNFESKCEVELSRAHIGGDLDCTNGEFCDPSGRAITANQATVKGCVFLRKGFSAGNGFSAEGEVRMLSARIGGDLDCRGGSFANPGGNALGAENVRIGGGLLWREKITGGGVVNLGCAKVNVLVDDLDSWNPFKVKINGFTYDQIVGPTDAESRIDWLAKRPGQKPFSPLPYEQATKVLRAMGKDIDAWDIEREKRRLEREERDSSNAPKVPLWRRLWGRTIDTLTDFVYRPWRTLGWAAGVVLAGAGFFGVAAHHGQIVPHQPAVLASEKYQAALDGGLPPMAAARAAFPSEYPEFSPLAYSLDVFIPFFALHQEPFWSPASGGEDDLWKSSFLLLFFLVVLAIVGVFAWLFQRWRKGGEDDASARAWAAVGMAVVSLGIAVDIAAAFAHILFGAESVWWFVDWRWLTVWHWIEIVAGWILTPLFLLSVTSILRPRQSSGEKD